MRSISRKTRSKRGFTLLEIMICMALLLFISAIFALKGKSFLDTYRFNTSIQLLKTEMEKAKFQSLIYRAEIELVLIEGKGGLKLAKLCDEPVFSTVKAIHLPAVAGVYHQGKRCKKLVIAKYSCGHCIASQKIELCNNQRTMKKEFTCSSLQRHSSKEKRSPQSILAMARM